MAFSVSLKPELKTLKMSKLPVTAQTACIFQALYTLKNETVR